MTPLLLAVDDGLTSGNLNAADIMFAIAAVLCLIAAVLLHPRPTTAPPYPVHGFSVLALAVGLTAFGLFLL
jgi:hypothetical protein